MEAYKEEKLNILFSFCSDVQFRIIKLQLMKIADKESFDALCKRFLECYKGCSVHEGKELLYNERVVRIDNKLVELMKAIWMNKIRTLGSCEGMNNNCETGEAYIIFETSEDLREFFELLGENKYKTSDYEYEDYGFNLNYKDPKQMKFPQEDIPDILYKINQKKSKD